MSGTENKKSKDNWTHCDIGQREDWVTDKQEANTEPGIEQNSVKTRTLTVK